VLFLFSLSVGLFSQRSYGSPLARHHLRADCARHNCDGKARLWWKQTQLKSVRQVEHSSREGNFVTLAKRILTSVQAGDHKRSFFDKSGRFDALGFWCCVVFGCVGVVLFLCCVVLCCVVLCCVVLCCVVLCCVVLCCVVCCVVLCCVCCVCCVWCVLFVSFCLFVGLFVGLFLVCVCPFCVLLVVIPPVARRYVFHYTVKEGITYMCFATKVSVDIFKRI
jgi:hypothetical protein